LLYSAFTAFLGFKVNNGEYKVMGMAPYGGPNRVEGVYKLAVTHEGGSGRLQTVRRDWNLLYYRAVELFGEATGVPVLLNTSFNLRGEPIVTTPTNALNTFDKSDIDTLYMDGFIVRKTGNDR
jgi:carbamoyltransferase